MAAAARGVFIVAAKRTPFGTFGGKAKDLSATELARVACVGALKAGNVPPGAVDSVMIGNVIQVGLSHIARAWSDDSCDVFRLLYANAVLLRCRLSHATCRAHGGCTH